MILLPLTRSYAREMSCFLKGDYGPSKGGKKAFWGVKYILEWVLRLDQINIPVLNFPIGPLPVYLLLTFF